MIIKEEHVFRDKIIYQGYSEKKELPRSYEIDAKEVIGKHNGELVTVIFEVVNR